MEIKYTKKEANALGPQEKLRLISFTEDCAEMYSTSINLSPQKRKPTKWIMDAWENNNQNPSDSPQRRAYKQKIVQDYSFKTMKLKKSETLKEADKSNNTEQMKPVKSIRFLKIEKIEKNQKRGEKENNARERAPSFRSKQLHSRHENSINCEPQQIPKIPLNSIVYPVLRKTIKSSYRRIDRFHSFVARSVRK